MIRTFITCLIILVGLTMQAQVSVAWSNFNGGVSLALNDANNVYSAWWDYNPAGDIYLTKRDTDGNIIWEEKYENTDNSRHEVATWVAVDNNNNIIVSGTIRSGYASPVNAASILMKFDPDGNLIWRTVYDTDFDGSYTVKCVLDADNNIYVLGRNGGPAVSEINKFNTDGDLLWTYLDEDGIGNPLNIKLTPDNHTVISGRWITGSGGGYAKIDADGNKVWAWADFGLTAGDVDGDAFGNSYVVHGQYDFDYGIYLIKIDPDGNIEWQEEHPMSAFRVEVGSDNNPVICGFPNSGSPGAAFVKYDADGNLLWENLDADGPSYGILSHAMMLMDADDNAYIAGSIMTAMAVCKVDALGNSVWTLTMGTGYSTAIAFGSDNNVYVTGGTTAKILQEPPVEICEPPLALLTNNIGVSTARFNWTPIPDVYQYEVWYKKTTAASWKVKFVAGTKNKLNVKNLQPAKDYVWKIRTVCASGVSEFSAEQYFTTLPLREGLPADEPQVLLYPNPVTDVLHVRLNKQENIRAIQILDIQGRIVYSQIPDNSESLSLDIDLTNIPITNAAGGMYLLLITSDSGAQTHSFVINR